MIVQAEITDPVRFQDYTAKTPLLVSEYGGQYICIGRHATLLEGTFGEGCSVVISVWPSRQAALDFWNSTAYQSLKEVRVGTGKFNVTLVDDLSAIIQSS